MDDKQKALMMMSMIKDAHTSSAEYVYMHIEDVREANVFLCDFAVNFLANIIFHTSNIERIKEHQSMCFIKLKEVLEMMNNHIGSKGETLQ